MRATVAQPPVHPAAADGRAADLLDAAARRFVAVGIGKTTMEDIARDAGAAKATLYRRFPNKAAVVDALLRRESARLDGVLRAAADDADTAAGKVAETFVAALGFLRGHPLLTKSLAEEPAVLLPHLSARSAAVVEVCMARFTELVGAGTASGEFRDVDAEWAAETLLRLVVSFFTLPAIVVRTDDPGQVRAYADALVTGRLVRVTAPGPGV